MHVQGGNGGTGPLVGLRGGEGQGWLTTAAVSTAIIVQTTKSHGETQEKTQKQVGITRAGRASSLLRLAYSLTVLRTDLKKSRVSAVGGMTERERDRERERPRLVGMRECDEQSVPGSFESTRNHERDS
jgi:hypothetical protein